jgi:hypothetical protein
MCGQIAGAAGSDATGGWNGQNLFLYINNNTNYSLASWNAPSAQRTFAHEIGHLLGLADYSATCDSTGNTAVMQKNFDCSPVIAPMAYPTVNDYLPVNNTVYGGGTRATCGFSGS